MIFKKIGIFLVWCILCHPTITLAMIGSEGEDSDEGGAASASSVPRRISLEELSEEAWQERFPHQIFAVPVFDAAFKYLLDDDAIRLDFIKLFAQVPDVVSSDRLDDSLNPLRELGTLRTLLHDDKTKRLMERIGTATDVQVILDTGKRGGRRESKSGAQFLKDLKAVFGDLQTSFPKQERGSRLDIVCRLSNKEYALVEVQVIPQKFWDARALAYAAAFYGNQLKHGDDWPDLKRVIAVNLLGGGSHEYDHWPDHPQEVIRHYRFRDMYPGQDNHIDMLQLIQYNVMHATGRTLGKEELREWLDFFANGHKKTEEDIEHMRSPTLKQAYEKMRLRTFPTRLRQTYIDESNNYERYSEHISREKDKAREEGEAIGEERKARVIARNLLSQKVAVEIVVAATSLSRQEVEKLQHEIGEQERLRQAAISANAAEEENLGGAADSLEKITLQDNSRSS